jgi:hypothetical protein
MTAAWRQGPNKAMQKTRVYVRAWVFEFATGGGRRPCRPIKRSARGESFSGAHSTLLRAGRRTPPVLRAEFQMALGDAQGHP